MGKTTEEKLMELAKLVSPVPQECDASDAYFIRMALEVGPNFIDSWITHKARIDELHEKYCGEKEGS